MRRESFAELQIGCEGPAPQPDVDGRCRGEGQSPHKCVGSCVSLAYCSLRRDYLENYLPLREALGLIWNRSFMEPLRILGTYRS